MKRRAWLAGGVALGAAGAGVGFALWRGGRSDGDAAAAAAALWAMRFEQPGGGELSMASLRGQPLLLNFWATWCAPCVKEMPLLDQFHREHQAAGWRVVGLAIDGLVDRGQRRPAVDGRLPGPEQVQVRAVKDEDLHLACELGSP